jgi:hypothetical protein
MGVSDVRQRAGRRHRAGRPEPDLVVSKLCPPPLRPGTVRRSLLIERLARGDLRPIVSVVAAPGYGKTTLLSQWAERDGRSFAWVSADEADNDPKVLLAYVAEVLDAVEPIDERVFDALASPGSSVPGSVVPRLGSAFASMTSPVVLVLDDVHLLHDRECRTALSVLADSVPAGSRLVLADPPVSVQIQACCGTSVLYCAVDQKAHSWGTKLTVARLPGSAGERSLDQGAVLVDQAGQEPQMHDHAIARGHEVHDLAHRRSFLITSDHQSSRADLARITSLVEEGPDVAGLILVVQVSGDTTRYISVLPSLKLFPSVRGIALHSTESLQQLPELLIVGAAQPHGVMRPLPGRQQLESPVSQAADGGQVDSPERGEPAPEQIIERLTEDRENRDSQQGLPVERPGTRGPLNMAAQLLRGVTATPYNHRRCSIR